MTADDLEKLRKFYTQSQALFRDVYSEYLCLDRFWGCVPYRIFFTDTPSANFINILRQSLQRSLFIGMSSVLIETHTKDNSTDLNILKIFKKIQDVRNYWCIRSSYVKPPSVLSEEHLSYDFDSIHFQASETYELILKHVLYKSLPEIRNQVMAHASLEIRADGEYIIRNISSIGVFCYRDIDSLVSLVAQLYKAVSILLTGINTEGDYESIAGDITESVTDLVFKIDCKEAVFPKK
jgi:hypothetical protein